MATPRVYSKLSKMQLVLLHVVFNPFVDAKIGLALNGELREHLHTRNY